MSSLRQQVAGLIETCKTVIAAKDRPPIDTTTIQVAGVILEQAKTQLPGDKVLAAVQLGSPITWTSVLTAMEMVERSLPLPQQARRQPFSSRR